MTVKLKTSKKKETSSTELIGHIVKGIEEKKGNDIVCINLKKIANAACDYFVICDANSRTQVQAIAGSVEEYVKNETGSRPWHVEGMQNAEWVLLDYVNVVVHVFQPQIRQHFGLEDMWADAEIKETKHKEASAKRKKTVSKTKTKKKVLKTKKKTVKRKKSKSK